MTTSEYDAYRPPEKQRRRRFGRRTGAGPDVVVPDAEFVSYYGRPIVKAPPWEWPVAAYLFLGGVAGGSGVIAAGGEAAGLPLLRRNARLGAIAAVSLGGAALVADLGRPERALNMLRTFKVTSPMSVGSWILTAFSGGIAVTAGAELDRLTGERLPLGPVRSLVRASEGPAGVVAAAFGPPLAAYTAVLLGNTANPTWNETHRDLPFVFVSSATLASSGLAMVTTPTSQTGPVRILACLGVLGDVGFMRFMESRMDPLLAETLREGTPGRLLRWSERLAIAGGVGAILGGRSRPVAVASGLALLTASALTRFGVFEAGKESAKDPKYVVEPQKRRLASRRARGIHNDSITTA